LTRTLTPTTSRTAATRNTTDHDADSSHPGKRRTAHTTFFAAAMPFKSKKRAPKRDSITVEAVRRQFIHPLREAALNLNVSLTYFKKVLREMGITKWPYRQLMSRAARNEDEDEQSEDEWTDAKGRQGTQVEDEEDDEASPQEHHPQEQHPQEEHPQAQFHQGQFHEIRSHSDTFTMHPSTTFEPDHSQACSTQGGEQAAPLSVRALSEFDVMMDIDLDDAFLHDLLPEQPGYVDAGTDQADVHQNLERGVKVEMQPAERERAPEGVSAQPSDAVQRQEPHKIGQEAEQLNALLRMRGQNNMQVAAVAAMLSGGMPQQMQQPDEQTQLYNYLILQVMQGYQMLQQLRDIVKNRDAQPARQQQHPHHSTPHHLQQQW